MLTRRQRLTKGLKRLRLTLSGRRGSATAVFVLGEMRSGTNMLAQALERHEKIECYHENDDEAFDNYVLRPPQHVERLVHRSYAQRVVFKSIADMGRASDLLATYGDSKAVFIFRHFEDVVNSALRSFTRHREYLAAVLTDEERAGWRRWGLSEQHLDLIRCVLAREISQASARALIWYVRNDAFLAQGLLASGAATILNYEALVQQPHAHFRQASHFIGLEYSPRMSRGVVATSVRRRAAPDIDADIAQICSTLFERMVQLATEQVSTERAADSAASSFS